jgi:hypothetical protein
MILICPTAALKPAGKVTYPHLQKQKGCNHLGLQPF